MSVQRRAIDMQTLLKVLILGFCWAAVYQVPFIHYLLYDPFRETIGASNSQLGALMTIYGIGNILGAPVGGWLADRFNYKYIYIASLAGNAILALIFSFHMVYSFAVFMWIGFAITSLLLNYPSHVKIIRLLASDENQGKIYGFNEASIGITTVAFNLLLLQIFKLFADTGVGIRYVILATAVLSIICTVVAFFIIPSPKLANGLSSENKSTDKMTFSDFLVVIKSPETWLIGIGILATYSFMVTTTYFTPYFTAALGLTATFAGGLAIVRNNLLRFVGGPTGGWLSDKIKSPTKVLMMVYLVGIISLIGFMMLPKNTSIGFIIFATFVITFFVYMGRGAYYAVATEIKVPPKYAATTIGVAAALGFSPDIFQFALAGHLLDKYGTTGYTYLFIFQIAILTIGLISGMMILKYKKRIK